MIGLLNEKTEIEKLQNEYKTLAEQNFTPEKAKQEIAKEELVLEECEL